MLLLLLYLKYNSTQFSSAESVGTMKCNVTKMHRGTGVGAAVLTVPEE